MRYSFVIFICLLIVGSCIKINKVERFKAPHNSFYISLEDAKKQSTSIRNMLYGLDLVKSDNSPISESFEIRPEIVTDNGTTSVSLYVLNYDNNGGFAIASADKRLPPVLCVTEKGSFSEDSLNSSPHLAFIFKYMLERIAYQRGIGYDPDSCGVAYGAWQLSNIKGTRLVSNWAQDNPFNAMCSMGKSAHPKAGCVPIAVAQILFFHGVNVTYNNYYYDWDVMHQIIDRTTPIPEAWPMVQHFIMDLGNSDNLDVSYGLESSSASSDNAPRTFSHFGLTSGGTLHKSNFNAIMSEVDSGYPVYADGNDSIAITHNAILPFLTDTTYISGHAWVIDQTANALRHVWVYNLTTNALVYHTMQSAKFVHCNWGWEGNCNGFFYYGDYDVSNPQVSTEPTKSVIDTLGYNNHYRYNLNIIDGIRP